MPFLQLRRLAEWLPSPAVDRASGPGLRCAREESENTRERVVSEHIRTSSEVVELFSGIGGEG